MVHWIYITECDNYFLYVGETTRLYRRMNEHQSGSGSINTGKHKPLYLVGLYKVAENASFLEYNQSIKKGIYDNNIIRNWGTDDSNYLDVENYFTELLISLRIQKENEDFIFNDGEWSKIRGGKYTKDFYLNPINETNKIKYKDRPCCECQIPAEVKLSKDKNCIYFVCALKNIWKDFSPGLKFNDPCEFFKIYTDDYDLKKKYETSEIKLKEPWCNNLPTSFEECIKCKNNQYTMIYSFGKKRQLCLNCFDKYYNELKKEYSIVKPLFLD